jgi:UDPglucose 6-dehydrogenase
VIENDKAEVAIMRIAVVGAGYVGMVQAVCLCDLGHSVVLIENDPNRYRGLIDNNLSPVKEPGVNEGLRRYRGSLLSISDKLDDIARCSIIFLCVGTPARQDDLLDMSQLEGVLQQIAVLLARRISQQLLTIVIKSTVRVGTCRRLRDFLQAAGVGPSSFAIIMNPEFFREGFGIADSKNPDRIVIGVDQEEDRGSRVLIDLYTRNSNHLNVTVMSWESAELVKLASNAFLASKVSFANMVSDVCELVGADSTDVLGAVGADSRIGAQFLKPGIGWGGGAFSKDLNALIQELNVNNVPASMLDGARIINRDRPRIFVQRMKKALEGLKGRRIGVWGLSYKGQTADVRDSPAISVVNWLLSEGAVVCAYDEPMPTMPHIPNLDLASDAIEALKGVEALCILNDNPQFSELLWSPECKRAMRSPVVFDGRNLYDPKEITAFGYTYISIGRRGSFSPGTTSNVLREATIDDIR